MTVSKDQILSEINNFIKEYEEMDINGVVINCPYWMNKIKAGKVVFRGFKDGKGTAGEIKDHLINKLQAINKSDNQRKDSQFIKKLAKRERIGIDCSGFAYRVLDELVQLRYINCRFKNPCEIFPGGIIRTNANMLTRDPYSIPVNNIADYSCGDLIRMMGGKHILVILSLIDSHIIYAHSSHITETQGVHRGKIRITDVNKSLDKQEWLEETKDGQNFGGRFFHTDRGDGVYRLKIFK